MRTDGSLAVVAHLVRRYPARTAGMVALLAASGAAEGVSAVALLPLLELGAAPAAGPASTLTRLARAGLAALGLRPTLEVLLAMVVLGVALRAGALWLAMTQVGRSMSLVATSLRLDLLRALMGARWSFFGHQPAGHFANAVGIETYRAAQAYR